MKDLIFRIKRVINRKTTKFFTLFVTIFMEIPILGRLFTGFMEKELNDKENINPLSNLGQGA